MGKAKKLRSLEWQQKQLQEETNQFFDEMINNINKKKDKGKDNESKNED